MLVSLGYAAGSSPYPKRPHRLRKPSLKPLCGFVSVFLSSSSFQLLHDDDIHELPALSVGHGIFTLYLAGLQGCMRICVCTDLRDYRISTSRVALTPIQPIITVRQLDKYELFPCYVIVLRILRQLNGCETARIVHSMKRGKGALYAG